MKVTVVSRSGRDILRGPLDLSDSATVADLQEAFHNRAKKFYPSRQRLTLPVAPGSKNKPVVLNTKKPLKEYFDENTRFIPNPLLLRVSCPTLNLPCLLLLPCLQLPWLWTRPCDPSGPDLRYVQPRNFTSSQCVQELCLLLDLGAYIAYYVNHPSYTPVSDLQMKIGFGFGLVCQDANFYRHILLKNLRDPNGSGGYQIPRGFLFNIVTCANYTTEIYQ
ncbi:hypothetical protein F2Q70_00043905 [Brassica cretica]|uniref:3-oxo-5-alpha-steroid 4-dehydrogenase C-terminal domain-containing protein n=1 Tax=Brassica cretica TaxID=69181 RepID=A0A8S9KFU9_BRACR|nr:hypothetical protein F2Q70_00043905 [Brassica cretica]